jgi:SAM-dependent methyltransferase
MTMADKTARVILSKPSQWDTWLELTKTAAIKRCVGARSIPICKPLLIARSIPQLSNQPHHLRQHLLLLRFPFLIFLSRIGFPHLLCESLLVMRSEYFHEAPNNTTFDAVWISEAMSHLPEKELFFRNAFSVLSNGGKLIIADWFKAEQLSSVEMKADIEPIEGN